MSEITFDAPVSPPDVDMAPFRSDGMPKNEPQAPPEPQAQEPWNGAPVNNPPIVPQTVEPLSAEDQARDMGWVPQEEFAEANPHMPPEAWQPAEQFVARAPHATLPKHELIDRSMEFDTLRADVQHLSKLVGTSFTRGMQAEREQAAARHEQAVAADNPQAALEAAQDLQRIENEIAGAQQAGPTGDNHRGQIDTVEQAFSMANAQLLQDKNFQLVFQGLLRENTPFDQNTGLPTHSHVDHAKHMESIKAMAIQQLGMQPQRQVPRTMPAQQMRQPISAQPPAKSWTDMPRELQVIANEFIARGAYRDDKGKSLPIDQARQKYVDELVAAGDL